MTVNGYVSFWYAGTGPPAPRPPLPGDRRGRRRVVGAGYTGLWSAYYLKKADPSLRIAVLESRVRRFRRVRTQRRLAGQLHHRRARPATTHAHGPGSAVLAAQDC